MPTGLLEPLSGSSMRPLAQLPGGGQAEVGNDKVWNLKQPEIDSGSYAYWAGRLGPRGAENWKNEKLAGWKSEVAAFMSDQLLNGRPQNKPLTMDEVSGLLNQVAPTLASDRDFMGRVGLWAKMWNDEAMALRDAEAKRAGNMYASGKDLGAIYSPEQRALMNRHGYLVRGPQTPLAASPGILDSQPTSQPAGSPKRDLFAGYFPSPGHRKAEEIQVTAQPEAWKSGLMARARQDEQTRGHAARRKFDQENPSSTWVTKTNPQTGMQERVWTGGQGEVDLGRKPESAGDMFAKVLDKYLNGGRAALNNNEWTYLQSRMAADKGDLMQKLGALFGTAHEAVSPAASAVPQPDARKETFISRAIKKGYSREEAEAYWISKAGGSK